jgi:tetratricopeptide (TPR) repeat protein
MERCQPALQLSNADSAQVSVRPILYLALLEYPEAEKLLREALEIERRALRPQQYDTLSSMGALGQLLIKEKRYAEAEKLNREQLEGMKRSLGPDQEDVADSAYSLACILSWEKSARRVCLCCGTLSSMACRRRTI